LLQSETSLIFSEKDVSKGLIFRGIIGDNIAHDGEVQVAVDGLVDRVHSSDLFLLHYFLDGWDEEAGDPWQWRRPGARHEGLAYIFDLRQPASKIYDKILKLKY
jgi:hypothetical protein